MENSEEVAALLRQRYPAARISLLDFDAHPDMSVPDQVRRVGGGVVGVARGKQWDGAAVARQPSPWQLSRGRGAGSSPSLADWPAHLPSFCSRPSHFHASLLTPRLLPSPPLQVKLMSESSVLVTPCGGLATVLTFMRPGASAVAMNYWHTLQGRSLQLEDPYYR